MEKRISTYLVLLFSIVSFAQGPNSKPKGFVELEIGNSAPDFKLPGIDGKTYQLSDFNESDILMIYFTGTHCPTSHGVENRLQQLIKDMKGKSFSIVAINPNHNDGLRPDEFSYSLYTESFEDSKRYAEDLGWTFPFLYDGEHQQTARAYGCLATPHVFVFDKKRKLRYQGRFDDSRFADPKTVKHQDARNAIEALLANKPVPVEKTRPHGCSTKWKERSSHVAEDEKEWKSIPVIVEEIDLETIKKLRENGTNKLRLINLWATWCVPCYKELPDIAAIARKFSRRNFEVITIALDKYENKERVANVLGKHHIVTSKNIESTLIAENRETNNYIYTGANTDELAATLDPEWPGPIPYSLLLDKDGTVLMRVSGVIDQHQINSLILDKLKTTWQPKN